MDVESLAALASFELIERQLPDNGKNQTIALIDSGSNVMNLTVMRNGQQIYAREQAFGLAVDARCCRHYGMNYEEAELPSAPPEAKPILSPFMENLALEVSRAAVIPPLNIIVDHLFWPADAVIPGIDES
jgi:type IV pilus assembly protein PilM